MLPLLVTLLHQNDVETDLYNYCISLGKLHYRLSEIYSRERRDHLLPKSKKKRVGSVFFYLRGQTDSINLVFKYIFGESYNLIKLYFLSINFVRIISFIFSTLSLDYDLVAHNPVLIYL